MKQSKALGIAVFISMMMTGAAAGAAENQVSTVDAETLFHSRLVQDSKGQTAAKATAAVESAAADLPQLNSRLRWAAVKTPAELAEEEKAARRQTKAIPIIITAADIDRERKAKKRGEKTETPALIAPRPVQPPKITPAPQPIQKPKAQQPLPESGTAPVQDTWELPPIQPVGSPQLQMQQETVALPAIEPVVAAENVPVETIVDAIVEATSVELVIQDVQGESVELPAVQPIR